MTATLDDFEHYIHQAIPVYTEKEEIGILKCEIETLKEENSKLKQDMYHKEILIKHLTETLNEEKAKQMPTNVKTRQTRKHQSRQNIPLETRNRFAPLQNTQDEVLDKKRRTIEKKKYYNTIIKRQYI